MSGHELTVGTSVIVGAGPARRLRGPGRRPGRARWAGLAAAARRAIGPRAAPRRAASIVRVWIVARPGQALGPLAEQVRVAIAATVERLLGLDLGAVTVLVDGVGG